MKLPQCTVEASSEGAAREAGALELGIAAGSLAAVELERGQWQVQATCLPALVEVAIRNEDMEAVVTRITAPQGDAPALTRNTVEQALAGIGVIAGVLAPEIDAMIEQVVGSGVEQRNVTVARAIPAQAGVDGSWVEHARAGSIVRPGYQVVERRGSTHGVPGTTVTGKPLQPRQGQKLHGRTVLGQGLKQRRGGAVAQYLGYVVVSEEGEGWSVEPVVTVAEDRTRALVDLREGVEGQPPLGLADVLDALTRAKVIHGIDLERLERTLELVQTRGTLPRPVAIAEWTPPLPAEQEHVEWHVEFGEAARTTSSGRVDFRERRSVINVETDQKLATCSGATNGAVGRTVDGRSVSAPTIEGKGVRPGEGVRKRLLEQGETLFEATRDGMLQFEDGEVRVVELLVVEGDVDYATGNLYAKGAVQVGGSVHEGFRVSAGGDVIIHGAVDVGVVECGGRLTVAGAVLGGEEARLSGSAGVVLHHAQNACIRSEGDVIIEDSDTGSEITCQGRLEALEGHGLLRGGVYAAARGVRVKELGSALGVPTKVTAGADATLTRELAAAKLALHEVERQGHKLDREFLDGPLRATAHLSSSSAAAVRRVVKAHREAVGTEAALRARYQRLEQALAEGGPIRIEVQGTIHPGVELRIGRAVLTLDKPLLHVYFEFDPETGQIAAHPLTS